MAQDNAAGGLQSNSASRQQVNIHPNASATGLKSADATAAISSISAQGPLTSKFEHTSARINAEHEIPPNDQEQYDKEDFDYIPLIAPAEFLF